MKGGLKNYIKDERELKLGGVFDQPKIEDVPAEFSVLNTDVLTKNQGNTDLCAAVSSSGAREVQELVELDYEFLFALAKSIEGDADGWGLSLDSVGKAWIKYGTIERKDRPASLEGKDLDYLRKLENWPNLPSLLNKASVHKAGSYMWTKGRYASCFDNIKTWVWKFKTEKRLPIMGITWGFYIRSVFIDTPVPFGTGHAMFLHPKGFVKRNGKEYMVVQNSYGIEAGERGHHYLSREVIDDGVTKYGAIMFQDITPEEARYYQENGAKKESIMEVIISLCKRTVALLTKLLR